MTDPFTSGLQTAPVSAPAELEIIRPSNPEVARVFELMLADCGVPVGAQRVMLATLEPNKRSALLCAARVSGATGRLDATDWQALPPGCDAVLADSIINHAEVTRRRLEQASDALVDFAEHPAGDVTGDRESSVGSDDRLQRAARAMVRADASGQNATLTGAAAGRMLASYRNLYDHIVALAPEDRRDLLDQIQRICLDRRPPFDSVGSNGSFVTSFLPRLLNVAPLAAIE
jgi:hypothetical protein